MTKPIDAPLLALCRALVMAGRNIDAMNVHQIVTHFSLASSKNAIEAMIDGFTQADWDELRLRQKGDKT